MLPLMLTTVLGQSREMDYVKPIIDAMKANAENRLKQEQLNNQKQQFQREMELRERELELQKKQQSISNPPAPVASENAEEAQRKVQLEIVKAMLELRVRYSDFSAYESKMATLADAFLPGKGVTIARYLEGLYILAKHDIDHPAATP